MTQKYEIDAIAFMENRGPTFVHVVRYEPEAKEAWHKIRSKRLLLNTSPGTHLTEALLSVTHP